MMLFVKIVELTPITPWKENRGGTSALQYHLLVERPNNIDVDIWTFNMNALTREEMTQVEKELRINIHVVEKTWWLDKQDKLKLLRTVLKYPMLSYLKLDKQTLKNIDSLRADGVWIYGEELFRISKQLAIYKRVHTFPDAESLFYERLGGWKKVVVGKKYRMMESVMDKNVCYHLVGEADVDWFEKMAPGVDARFIRHPHYELVDKKIGFGKKVQLLVAGRNDIYMRGTANEMIEAFQEILKTDVYEVTFLGRGWKDEVGRLRQVGYDVNWKEYVENYVAEVAKYDIQISPLSLGTGTKGKVLDAMANGVLVVGTEYALENIAGGGVLYRTKEELKNVLLNILSDRAKYEKMASEARDNVRREHDCFKVSQEMFGLFNRN